MPSRDTDRRPAAPGISAEQERETALKRAKELFERTGSQDAVLYLLSSCGLPIVDAIKGVRSICAVSLRESKELCVRSGLWHDQVEASRPLHDEIERVFRDGWN